MSIKINKLEIENVKRVKAVKMEPAQNGLTIIGGRNNQGKTSVLDSIAWALGGNTFRPTDAKRDGSAIDPYLHIVMSNGLVVERKGKNSDLKVTDPSGQKAGQQLLDSFVEKLALNLPKFMEASDQEKADTLLNIIGIGPKLKELEKEEKDLYQERLTIGRIADQKDKFAKEQAYYPDAPKELVSAGDLIHQQRDIMARNAQRTLWKRDRDRLLDERAKVDDQIRELTERLRDLDQKLKDTEHSPKEMQMESTAELEKNIANVEEINRKVRANLDKDKAEEDALTYKHQYERLSDDIMGVRKKRMDLLNHANLPLPELTVEDGKLKYKGQQWDNMSGSDRLKVATAIVRKLNPECGFVLVDKLEQMDMDSLKEFGEWAESEGLQIIATRVSTGSECSIIISDGYGEEVQKESAAPQAPMKDWNGGF